LYFSKESFIFAAQVISKNVYYLQKVV